MLKPHLALAAKTTARLKFETTLLKAAKGLFAAALICAGLFFLQLFGNPATTKASVVTSINIKLWPAKTENKTRISPEAEISYSTDSLFVNFKSDNKAELKNAFLYVGDLTVENISDTVFKTVTLTEAKKINEQNYRIALALAALPEMLMIETHASFLNEAKTDEQNAQALTEYISRVKFNRSSSSFLSPPADLNSKNITSKTATVSWSAVTSAYKYRIRYRKSGEAAWKMGTVTAPGLQRPMVNLQPSSNYEFQVQAYIKNQKIDSTGYSPVSNFTTAPEVDSSVTVH